MGETHGQLSRRRHRQAAVRQVEDATALRTAQGSRHRLPGTGEPDTGGPPGTVPRLRVQTAAAQ